MASEKSRMRDLRPNGASLQVPVGRSGNSAELEEWPAPSANANIWHVSQAQWNDAYTSGWSAAGIPSFQYRHIS
jgi:hypothetical protein